MRAIASTVALLLIACASAAPDSTSKKAPRDEPEIVISQLSDVGEAARHMTGGISVQYRVEVANRAKDLITVKRIDVVSIGSGAYDLRPTSIPFAARLLPGESKALDFWGAANISNPTILGANGPVTLRITLYYDTPAGGTQSIVVQQVHAGG